MMGNTVHDVPHITWAEIMASSTCACQMMGNTVHDVPHITWAEIMASSILGSGSFTQRRTVFIRDT